MQYYGITCTLNITIVFATSAEMLEISPKCFKTLNFVIISRAWLTSSVRVVICVYEGNQGPVTVNIIFCQ